MSEIVRLQNGQGYIIRVPGVGISFMASPTVPADTSTGFCEGCVCQKLQGTAGAQFYINEGSSTSCAFKPLSALSQSITNSVIGNATITSLTATNETFTNLTAVNGATLIANTGNGGFMIGTGNNQKISLWAATPVVQPSSTGELVGLSGNAATAANATNMNSNGNTGNTAYTFSDVVKALKQIGALKQ